MSDWRLKKLGKHTGITISPDMVCISSGMVLVLLFMSFGLPIFRSGMRENLNFWQFILNHTIWGPPVEYIPEELYMDELRPADYPEDLGNAIWPSDSNENV